MRTVAERRGFLRPVWVVATLLGFVLFPVMASAAVESADHVRISPSLREINDWGEHARVAKSMLGLIQVAAMLAAAKLLGWLCERIKVPGVIGELLAGVLIGPYVLGHMIQIPLAGHWSPLFPAPVGGEWPINDIVWSLAQFASVILLFITGLHTRSEEHTSELQSPCNLVCRLLLEKKNFGININSVIAPPNEIQDT